MAMNRRSVSGAEKNDAASTRPTTISINSSRSSSLSSTSSKKPSTLPPPPATLPPYGKSLFFIIWDRDPAPPILKSFYVAMTIAGLACLLVLPRLLIGTVGLDGRWDENNGVDKNSLVSLLEHTLGLPVDWVRGVFFATAGLCVSLVVADLVLGTATRKPHDDVWPKSWNTDNCLSYNEMFSEPTRSGRLLRRPGNTLSNASYFFASVCILLSITQNQNFFCVADAEFGIMLFILSVASTIWHGSNAPWSQYPDLWSMDCCILYLIIRYACFGGLCVATRYTTMDMEYAKLAAGWSCAVLFTCVIIAIGRFHLRHFQKKWLHGPCPYSVRARILGKSDIFGQGHQDIHIGSTVCAYAALPVYYTAIPTLIQLIFVGSVGSVLAANLAFRTLVVGWSYRMFDRWTLDGCVFINYFVSRNNKPSLMQTVGAAVFSPTAVLHALTGITLLAGYMHARSVDGLV